jgi:uroporphyrin-III C-methyltransferase / precorrin-2 dehydrogenase / sirohydrochlorin ferrochelatase
VIHSLPLFHRIADQPVIVLGQGDAASAKRRLVERAGGVATDDEHAEARLAFVALDDPEPAAARLRARGVLVNVPDRPELCDFTVPSILDRAPVLIAVGTGGASAGLAKALRLRLETLLPHSLGALALALAAARTPLRARWPGTEARRHALDAALGPGGALDPLDDQSAGNLNDWLAGAGELESEATVELRLISADPGDLTLRQLRLLGAAGFIVHEADVPEAILNMARADAARRIIRKDEAPTNSGPSTVILRFQQP